MNLFTKQKQTHTHRNQTYGYQKEQGVGRDKLGVWDQQIQTTTYEIDKQQGPTVQHSRIENIQYPVINQNKKNMKKIFIYN